ncbi:hypothetical protein N9C70_04665 [Flavobacteriales bacterium]|nr:hypothetical protein [Flavobacteriales bacterium]
MTKCLACKARIEEQGSGPYTGDFCSEYCFSSYPGHQPKMRTRQPVLYQRRTERNAIGRILERNHSILRAFKDWHDSAPTMSDIGGLQWLREKGFAFEYHTHVRHVHDGGTEVWVYDTGYRLERDGHVKPVWEH